MKRKMQEIIENIKKPEKICGLICMPILRTSELGLEEFGVFQYFNENELNGINGKGFYRVSTEAIENAVKEIKTNPNSSIITCYNDAISEGELPQKISVMLKETISHLQPDSLATSVLNYFEVPTSINLNVINDTNLVFPIEGDGTIYYEKTPTNKLTMSIDFLGEGDTFKTFADCGIPDILYSFDPLYANTMTYLNKLCSENPFSELSQKEKDTLFEKIRDQLAMSYLVRQFVCWDIDFAVKNIGFIVNEQKKDINIINFDYEFSFKHSMPFSEQIIKSVQENAPDAYNKFISKCKSLVAEFDEANLNWYNERMDACGKLNCTSHMLLDLYDTLNKIIDLDMEYKRKMEKPPIVK